MVNHLVAFSIVISFFWNRLHWKVKKKKKKGRGNTVVGKQGRGRIRDTTRNEAVVIWFERHRIVPRDTKRRCVHTSQVFSRIGLQILIGGGGNSLVITEATPGFALVNRMSLETFPPPMKTACILVYTRYDSPDVDSLFISCHPSSRPLLPIN